MYKKPIVACMALAAFLAIVVAPSVALATNEPTLVDLPPGHVAVGSLFIGTPVGETTFTDTAGNGLVHCQVLKGTTKLTGKVLKNSGGTVEGEITTRDFAGTGTTKTGDPEPECTGSFGNVFVTVPNNLVLKANPLMATHEFQVTNVGSTKVKFILDSTTVGLCEYESAGPIKGDFTTNASTSALTVRNTVAGSGSTRIKGGLFCPSSGMLKMTFHLETENGTPIGIL